MTKDLMLKIGLLLIVAVLAVGAILTVDAALKRPPAPVVPGGDFAPVVRELKRIADSLERIADEEAKQTRRLGR